MLGNESQAWHIISIAAPTALHDTYDLCLYALPPTVALVFVPAYGVAGAVVAVRLTRGMLSRDANPC